MSREIEFRAWDKDEQEYCYNAERTYDFLCSRRGCLAESFGDVLDQTERYFCVCFSWPHLRHGDYRKHTPRRV